MQKNSEILREKKSTLVFQFKEGQGPFTGKEGGER